MLANMPYNAFKKYQVIIHIYAPQISYARVTISDIICHVTISTPTAHIHIPLLPQVDISTKKLPIIQ